mmetsp:Transcript_42766/g.77262  ORF Transcript_42766/g.77262 Transcript_42766/m.77262 type:complete len:218 (-) Transcript_42766:517-1170(-)
MPTQWARCCNCHTRACCSIGCGLSFSALGVWLLGLRSHVIDIAAAHRPFHLQLAAILRVEEPGEALTKQLVDSTAVCEDDKAKTAVVVRRRYLAVLGCVAIALQPGLLNWSDFTEEFKKVVLAHVLRNATHKDFPHLRWHSLLATAGGVRLPPGAICLASSFRLTARPPSTTLAPRSMGGGHELGTRATIRAGSWSGTSAHRTERAKIYLVIDSIAS